MTEAESNLRDGLKILGFVDELLPQRLLDFAGLVLGANAETNLVGASSIVDLIATHLLDSLAPLAGRSMSGQLIDIGSGAGFPAVPIAMAFASVSTTMLEPRAKRADFLTRIIGRLSLKDATARKVMAETAGRSDLRESADIVTVRAVAAPATALELAIPLLKRRGKVLLYVGRQQAPNEHELGIADLLGGALVEAKAVEVPYLQSVRHGWWFEKKKPTPSDYPRRAKVPSKQPL
ncbi:MAG TPA: 16S rRNA (guanine(527)-N(7))-methyltransferase RsmG [Candidatus Eremiobacteraceae bacterium]|nr:16S rRNA (guanine(527)-N(7))-methyltransferase RsmG [Candidatus Eremiobacteraceae bacterium]